MPPDKRELLLEQDAALGIAQVDGAYMPPHHLGLARRPVPAVDLAARADGDRKHHPPARRHPRVQVPGERLARRPPPHRRVGRAAPVLHHEDARLGAGVAVASRVRGGGVHARVSPVAKVPVGRRLGGDHGRRVLVAAHEERGRRDPPELRHARVVVQARLGEADDVVAGREPAVQDQVPQGLDGGLGPRPGGQVDGRDERLVARVEDLAVAELRVRRSQGALDRARAGRPVPRDAPRPRPGPRARPRPGVRAARRRRGQQERLRHGPVPLVFGERGPRHVAAEADLLGRQRARARVSGAAVHERRLDVHVCIHLVDCFVARCLLVSPSKIEQVVVAAHVCAVGSSEL